MKNIEKKIIEFSILREIEYNDRIPTPEDYDLDQEDYVSLIKDMVNKQYLNSERILFNILGEAEIEKEIDLVTEEGNDFIESNEVWNKIYNSIQDVRKFLREVRK